MHLEKRNDDQDLAFLDKRRTLVNNSVFSHCQVTFPFSKRVIQGFVKRPSIGVEFGVVASSSIHDEVS